MTIAERSGKRTRASTDEDSHGEKRGPVPHLGSELVSRASASLGSRRLLGWGTRHARESLRLDLLADADAPRTARRAIAGLAERAGASREELDAVHTIISEAVTNVVRHAYPDGPGPVYIDAAVVGRDLSILIVDAGRGPRVPSPHPGLGMGWKLMAQLTTRWTVVARGEGGTMLYLRLRLRQTDRSGGRTAST
ncbi:MAG TPA: ATP-binding protein [Solirubrobacteraceae bacterium]|nr:ATP-binding protein [Solirubrobacteraceae bacterium]